ncbi:hypothetical protein DAMA08_027230 [Martiniozyma asiatica (nom. inval.)]|nr:hypothetical protein DAMA08_027230 [Martiniozyma asiatica]
MASINIDTPKDGFYSLNNNRVTGSISFTKKIFKRKYKYGFRGFLYTKARTDTVEFYDRITFFDYEKETTKTISLFEFEFPCHDLYLPSSMNLQKGLIVKIVYEIYTDSHTQPLSWMGKTLENMEMDSGWSWFVIDSKESTSRVDRAREVTTQGEDAPPPEYKPIDESQVTQPETNNDEINSLRIGMQDYINILHPIGLVFPTNPPIPFNMKVQIKVNVLLRMNGHTWPSSYLINFDVGSDESIFEALGKNNQVIPMNCSISNLLEVKCELLIGVAPLDNKKIIWINTSSKFDVLIEERAPPIYYDNFGANSKVQVFQLEDKSFSLQVINN